MKVKSFCYRSIATLLCIVFLSLSVGGKFCYYNDISKSYAADPFTLTMGGVALEEVFMAIAVAILGYDVAYQYRDELVDAFKKGIAEEIANGNGVTLDNNMLTAYIADAVNPYTTSIPWSDYLDVLNGMGASASSTFEDFADSFANTYVKPSKEYLQQVAEWWGNFITENTMPNYEAVVESAYYIDGLSEIMQQQYITSSDVWKIISTNEEFNYRGGISYEYDFVHPYYSDYSGHRFQTYMFDFTSCDRVCCYYVWKTDSAGCSGFNIGFYGKVGSDSWEWYKIPFICTHNTANDFSISTSKSSLSSLSDSESDTDYYKHNLLLSWSMNVPVFGDADTASNFAKTGQGIENALNYATSLADIAITGDDIPTVGNWEDLWERLKNPDLPWWWGNTDALANQEALPWFDVPALHDWASDIPDITDGVIADNPDIPWTDVYDKVIDIPDVIIPDEDFPYNPSIPSNPSIPADPSKPADPAIPADPTVDIPLDLTDELTEVADYVPTIADSFGDLGNGLKTKFPFSIPWDIYYILNGLATTPKAPYFELPLKVERYGIDETIIVDMSRFQVLSDLSRSIFSMLFMIVLINLTIKVIGSIKEES